MLRLVSIIIWAITTIIAASSIVTLLYLTREWLPLFSVSLTMLVTLAILLLGAAAYALIEPEV